MPASTPSSSTSNTAWASIGNPAVNTLASTARMIALSIISKAAGNTPAAMIAETARLARSTSVKSASRVRAAGGIGESLTVASVAIPNVPSEPTNTPRRS